MQTKYFENGAKLQAINETLVGGTLLASLNQDINTSDFNATTQKGGADVATLGKNLGIGLAAANRTRAVITQRG
jgi:hypothetical protein